MFRRLAIVLLALVLMPSFGGILSTEAQVAGAERCCKSSCPKSQHRDPVRCCSLNLFQSTAEVSSVNHAAPEPTQITVLNAASSSFLPLHLRPLSFEKIHPPPGPSPSPVRLCSLQI